MCNNFHLLSLCITIIVIETASFHVASNLY
uniref:Uncharacterized protein n=1 Tax=Anguilla anguilla TaxID=7936 RepID=A0A0E9RPU0_ANGAN